MPQSATTTNVGAHPRVRPKRVRPKKGRHKALPLHNVEVIIKQFTRLSKFLSNYSAIVISTSVARRNLRASEVMYLTT